VSAINAAPWRGGAPAETGQRSWASPLNSRRTGPWARTGPQRSGISPPNAWAHPSPGLGQSRAGLSPPALLYPSSHEWGGVDAGRALGGNFALRYASVNDTRRTGHGAPRFGDPQGDSRPWGTSAGSFGPPRGPPRRPWANGTRTLVVPFAHGAFGDTKGSKRHTRRAPRRVMRAAAGAISEKTAKSVCHRSAHFGASEKHQARRCRSTFSKLHNLMH
jgi:hypothetical protein